MPRVLVVENDLRVRDALTELLRSWGYETESASEGQEALERIPKFDPVLVISDLRMPGMGGMDLLKQVRETRPGINFIMLTGHASIDEAVEATKLGAF
ncbi:MAG: transcriptional regulator, partial [Acidobacteria bacterium]